MKINLLFKKVITFIISFIFLTQHTINAATGINMENRTSDIAINISNSSTPSDLPVIGYSDFFDKEKINLIQGLDLRAYVGKKVFVGYGVYDKNEDNCKFLEQPGVSKSDYNSAFSLTKTSNQHSYGLSSSRMTYSQCLSLGDRLGGYPVVIDSATENYFLNSTFTKKTINSSLIEKIWIGATIDSCTDVNYTNAKDNVQYFEKFVDDETKGTCSNSKLNLKQNTSGYFEKTGSEVSAYCVIEFDSEDMYKPFKVCAPWWKVEREYKLEDNSDFYKSALLKRINQSDIPIQLVACTAYNEVINTIDTSAIRTANCTEYYSATILPECTTNMYQAQCKVSECNGYIQNACTLKDSKTVGKGYVKGEVLINGTLTETKVKDNVITNEYECPASTYSKEYCTEESNVIIYPLECPLSQCTELKECTLAAGTDSTALNLCYDTYTCTKIYGGRDIAPITDPVTNEVTHLRGKCPDAPVSDGSILNFPINVQSKLTKKCLEYEIIETEDLINQKCTLERSYTDYSVDMSITDVDNYESNPSCLRMDTSEESQIEKNLYFKVTNKNYFKNKISKVYLDGTYETLMDSGMDDFLIYSALPNLTGVSSSEPQVTVSNTTIGSSSDIAGVSGTTIDVNENNFLSCSSYDPALDTNGNITNQWYNRNFNVFTDGVSADEVAIQDSNILSIDTSGTYAIVSVSDSVIDNETQCANYASAHGITSYINYTYSKNPTNNVDYCKLNLTKYTGDTNLSTITAIGTDSLKYAFGANMSGEECLKKAFCLDGVYNESSFSSMQSVNTCIVTTGEGSPSSYDTYVTNKIMEATGVTATNNTTIPSSIKDSCIPPESSVNTATTIDGVENIIIVEDYVGAGFGYYSNNNVWRALSNKISITTDSFTDKTLTIPEISYITDFLSYHGIYKHESWKAKKPDIAASLIGGAMVGLAITAMSVAATSLAATASAAAMSAALLAGEGMAIASASSAAAGAPYLAFAAGPLLIGVVVIIVILVLLVFLAKSSSMDRQYTEYHVFKDVPLDKYNRGLYETRLTGSEAYVEGEASPHDSTSPANFIRMTYWHAKTDTGRQKPGPFLDTLKMLYKNKKGNMVCGGIEESEVAKATHPDELSINYGYPKCKWYKPSCQKVTSHYAELISNSPMLDEHIDVPTIPVANSSSVVTNIEKIRKDVGTIYMGAVNTMVVLVPFKGDYKLEALNKYGAILSTRTIHEDSFAGVTDANAIEYAQVNFGLSMNLASNMVEGTTKDACTKDRTVEWGGGVSGVFIEAGTTDLNQGCSKSNDQYVKDNSMVEITVQPLNMDRKFTYKLTKPMPFPNRVFLASLNDKEIRNYRCYDDFNECDDEDFIQEVSE